MKTTLNLAIILATLLISCQPSTKKDTSEPGNEFQVIFDGENLDNWDGDTTYWRVERGVLIGQTTPDKRLKGNSFIVWRGGKPANFELKLDFRISEKGNSGINYRSKEIDSLAYALRGYQGDLDGANNYTGMNYEEKGRTTLAQRGEKVVVQIQPNPETEGSFRANIESNAWKSSRVVEYLGHSDSLTQHINNGDWNEFHIIADGNNLKHYVNGVLMSELTDEDSVNRTESGLIGLQVHTGPPMKVEYKNIRLKKLD